MEDVRGFRRPDVRLKSGLAINCAKQRGFGNESVRQPLSLLPQIGVLSPPVLGSIPTTFRRS
jgi:hypothetical protein